MSVTKPRTISARVAPRTRRLAELAAEQRGVTLSAFTAEAIERTARKILLGPSQQSAAQTPEGNHQRGASG